MTDSNVPAAITPEGVKARYEHLCAVRDEREAAVAPLRAKLKAAADAAEAARVAAMAVRAELDAARGPDWFALKREIGMLAKLYQQIKSKEPSAPVAAGGGR